MYSDADAAMQVAIDNALAEARRTGWHWRYLANGNKCHALKFIYSNADAACGVGGWPSEWLGTGSQVEYEKAATMTRCRRCARIIGVATT